MRTIDQINEDIDHLLDEHEALREEEREQDLQGATQQQRAELREARRRNDAELALARQERWEHNVLRNLAAESEALFDAKLRHAAAHEAHVEACSELMRVQYGPMEDVHAARVARDSTYSDLCEAALHLSNVQAVFASTKESAAHCAATGRALRSAGHITRALAA